jgi:primosomal replication protein N
VTNQLQLVAALESIEPMRRTPAGVMVVSCTLAHRSQQQEAGLNREVTVELEAVALGQLASLLTQASPGMQIAVTGFLAAKSLRNRKPVLHLNAIEFLEGNQNGFQAQIQV